MKLLTLFSVVILMFSSCKKEEDKNVIPSDIYGTYRGDCNCVGGSVGDNYGDKIIVSEHSEDDVSMWLQTQSLYGFDLIVKVDGSSLIVESQKISNITYSGSGTYSSGHIVLSLNSYGQNFTMNCNYASTKQ